MKRTLDQVLNMVERLRRLAGSTTTETGALMGFAICSIKLSSYDLGRSIACTCGIESS